MGKVVEIDCEKPMKLETSPKVKKICAGFITVSVKKLLHYRAGGLLQYRAFYYIIGQLLHYRAFFITLSVGTEAKHKMGPTNNGNTMKHRNQ